jgi:hypothetical protein
MTVFDEDDRMLAEAYRDEVRSYWVGMGTGIAACVVAFALIAFRLLTLSHL